MNAVIAISALQLALIALATTVSVVALVAVALLLRRPGTTPRSDSVADTEALLNPVREQVSQIIRQIQEMAREMATNRTGFEHKIEEVLRTTETSMKLNQDLRETTTRISTALSGTGVRGNWGQVQLRRVVELAGLTEHVTFIEQTAQNDSDGKRFIPDMIVRLPGGRQIVVDAKSPDLNITGELDGRSQATALKARINELARKEYASTFESMDAVVLFVPSEGVLASAFSHDPTLGEYAMAKRIAIATPMTMFALLRAVEFGWRQQQQESNSKEILTSAVELVNRLDVFVGHFANIGSALKNALGHYNSAVGSYNQRLFPQAAALRDLGVKPTRDSQASSEPLSTMGDDTQQIRND